MANDKIRELLYELEFPYTPKNAIIIEQAVGETILAILATDTRPLVYTTFDKGLANAVISRVVDSVRKHWNFDATNRTIPGN